MIRRLIILTALAICATGGLSAETLGIRNETGIPLKGAMVYVLPGLGNITFSDGIFFDIDESVNKPTSRQIPMDITKYGRRHLLVTSKNNPTSNDPSFRLEATVSGNSLLVPIGTTSGIGGMKSEVIIQGTAKNLSYYNKAREILGAAKEVGSNTKNLLSSIGNLFGYSR